MSNKSVLNVGVIGTGFMGKAHVFGYTSANKVFDLPYDVVLHTIADVSEEAARNAARQFDFLRYSNDWKAVVTDPVIDVISITAPNALHKEMALLAIEHGKHVYCEKPLAPIYTDALEMAEAAELKGVKTQVGFNYLCNPMLTLAKKMISDGEIGDIRGYRGIHCEGYMVDPNEPFSFRHDEAGGGALADIGSHAIATAEFLLGPISSVLGDCVTYVKERRHPKSGEMIPVKVDDIGRSFVRFANGASGSIEGNWVATGRTMQHDFEVFGSKGAIAFSQENFNELHYYSSDDKPGQRGFRRIEAGPDHFPYGQFCVAPGHQLGFNDLKAIEVRGFLEAVANKAPEPFSFRDGARIQNIIESIHSSSKTSDWFDIKP